jgi:hypothetical protein
MWLILGLLGCTSTESRCETVCHYGQKCLEATATCSESEIDQCVNAYDNASDSCQDAFDEAADCVDEQEVNCSGVMKQCVTAETTAALDRCNLGVTVR